jgi:hypothetical protein
MTELIGGLVLLGIVVAIAGIYIISRKIEKHTRDTTEAMIYSNEMMLDQLKRLDPSASVPEPTVGVILERRCAHRRVRIAPVSEWPQIPEQRRSAGRRREDARVNGQAEYSRC